jgi:hypothetical protein
MVRRKNKWTTWRGKKSTQIASNAACQIEKTAMGQRIVNSLAIPNILAVFKNAHCRNLENNTVITGAERFYVCQWLTYDFSWA